MAPRRMPGAREARSYTVEHAPQRWDTAPVASFEVTAITLEKLKHPLQTLADWHRRRLIRRHPIDEALWRRTVAELPVLAALEPGDRLRLRDLTTLFLRQKHFAGTHGLLVDPYMQTVIAAQACLLVLNLGLEYFRGWRGIVVYETGFLARHQYEDESGLVYEVTDALDGEAWDRGPVVVSWAEIDPAGRVPVGEAAPYNVVVHEFAHKLDYLDGDANGCPPLHGDVNPAAWKAAFSEVYDALCLQVDHDEATVIDPYAAESPAELFAVATEYFFEAPVHLATELPAVYAQLAAFYRQDPAARPAP